MKKLLVILIIISFTFTSFAEEMFFGITSPVKTNLNILIQNGPTPNLQLETFKEKKIPENNLMKELEMRIIEYRTSSMCV